MLKREDSMPYANRRLAELILDKTEGNAAKFAEAIGQFPQTISRLLVKDKRNGRFPRITDHVIQSIMDAYDDIDVDYFALPPNTEEIYPLQDLHEDFDRLKKNGLKPHIPMSLASAHRESFADCIMKKQAEYRPSIAIFPDYDMTIDVSGDSMAPKYEKGDILFLKQTPEFVKPGEVYVLDTADGAVFSRVYPSEKKFRCVSYNKEYDDFYVERSQVFGIYKVIGMARI